MRTAVLALSLIMLFAVNAFSQPVDIPPGAACIGCGMKVDPNSLYCAEIIDNAGKLMAFCDMGDMFTVYKKMKDKPEKVYVKDYASGEWVSATAAYYVKSDKFVTPMGWAIAAFKSKEQALKFGRAMDFDKALDAVSPKKR